MRGEMVPPDIFDLAVKERDAFRQRKAAAPRQVIRVARRVSRTRSPPLALMAMAVLPLLEIVLRRAFGVGIPGSGPIVQHLMLWVGFLGAAIAARDGKLLALATGTFIPEGPGAAWPTSFAAAVGAAVSALLAWGARRAGATEREVGTIIGAGIPAWVAQLVLPVAFALIAARLVWRAGPTWRPPCARRRSGIVAGAVC